MSCFPYSLITPYIHHPLFGECQIQQQIEHELHILRKARALNIRIRSIVVKFEERPRFLKDVATNNAMALLVLDGFLQGLFAVGEVL
jgi:hypothetical protein